MLSEIDMDDEDGNRAYMARAKKPTVYDFREDAERRAQMKKKTDAFVSNKQQAVAPVTPQPQEQWLDDALDDKADAFTPQGSR
jgi:hypothetical protein